MRSRFGQERPELVHLGIDRQGGPSDAGHLQQLLDEVGERALALKLGVRSMLSYRLYAKGRTFGALDFYSKRPNVYSPCSKVIGRVFASHAGVALKGVLTEAGFEKAIQSRDIIEHIPVRDIAAQIVATGEIP